MLLHLEGMGGTGAAAAEAAAALVTRAGRLFAGTSAAAAPGRLPALRNRIPALRGRGGGPMVLVRGRRPRVRP